MVDVKQVDREAVDMAALMALTTHRESAEARIAELEAQCHDAEEKLIASEFEKKALESRLASYDALVEALGFDPSGFVAEARVHAKDMPRCIQRDYLNAALDKIEAAADALKKVGR